MWARIIEVMIGIFLAMSSFIFPAKAPLLLFNLSVALWIWICSFTSFYYPLRKVHLLNFLAIAALVLVALFKTTPPPPPYQNYVVIALLLILFAIIPTHASTPPEPWLKYYKKQRK